MRDLCLHVDAGETYGLLGPNGAGKSTAISMIVGLLEPDAVTVTILGEPMTTRSIALRARVGLVPQDLAIYPDLTARENLMFFARLYDLPRAEARSRVDEVLEVIGLADRADDRADDFSGGMKRRLNIGIGLLNRPTLLVLDEPTVGVDPQSRNAILEAVEALAGEGMAILYTTHYMEEAERLCDRIGIIDAGELKAEGTHRDLVRSIGERDIVRVGVAGAPARAAEALGKLPAVHAVTTSDHAVELLVDDATRVVAAVVDATEASGTSITSVEIVQPNLEAVFLHLTGRALRD